MKRLFLFILCAGMAPALTPVRRLSIVRAVPKGVTISQAGSAAFRDGLYLGRFDAVSRRARHLCVGRWSTDENRARFAAGYGAGYQR